MNEGIIKEIVEKVFEKAKVECAVHTRNSLSNFISSSTAISSKTVERLYGKYIEKKGTVGKQNEHTINMLCQYLNFESYADYVKQNGKENKNVKREKNWKRIVLVSLIIGVGLILILRYNENSADCMVWKKDHFEKIDCSVSYKEKVVPFNAVRLKNFKKVAVNLSTKFFNEENNNPLIWYYKSGDKVEFYSAPGLHPINGKTLKAITPYMIDKHIPIHSFVPSSFTE